jgi:hypothetical protein
MGEVPSIQKCHLHLTQEAQELGAQEQASKVLVAEAWALTREQSTKEAESCRMQASVRRKDYPVALKAPAL